MNAHLTDRTVQSREASYWLLAAFLVCAICPGLHAASWPQYRADASRSGYTSESLPKRMTLAWKRIPRHKPYRAWVGNFQAESRMRFDWSYNVVVADGTCYFGSSADHKVYALDAATGKKNWEFFTGGPVRLAPAVWRNKVFAVSDDGCLYCLSARNGRELWKIRVGPEPDYMVGNGRIVSRWAARGGPAVRDGIVYFGAGNWAMEGVYIYAIDAQSGKVIWMNDDAGFLTIEHPHMASMSQGGVIAQGYLAVTSDKVYVATGRATPAAFDRKTGRFLYFHLSRYGGKTPKAIGGGDITATDEVFFNSGMLFDAATGMRHHLIGKSKWWEKATYFGYEKGWMGEGARGANRIVCAAPKGFIRSEGGTIYGSVLGHRTYSTTREAESYFYTSRLDSTVGGDPNRLTIRVEPKHRSEKVKNAPYMVDRWSLETGIKDHIESLIVAGDTIVLGTTNKVALIDREARKITWQAKVAGVAYGLAAADRKLFVSTDQGVIYCFAGSSHSDKAFIAQPQSKRSPYSPESAAAKAVDEIIKKTGITKGYTVDLDCGRGALAYELAVKTDLHVIALAGEDEDVAQARLLLDQAGVYGMRVQVLRRSEASTYLPDYFANLIVSSKTLAGESTTVAKEEISRIQRPCGGVVCFGKAGNLRIETRGELEGAGEWTHALGDAGNSLNSGDTIVKGPLGLLWYEDETLVRIDRHGKNPSPLFYEGVMLRLGRDAIRAVDAYNGTKLWEVSLPGVLAGMTGGTGVGATASGGTYCLADGIAYVRYKDRCVRLDAFTGEDLGSYKLPDEFGRAGEWAYIAVLNDAIVGTVANEIHIVKSQHGNGGPQNQLPMEKMFTESQGIFALDAGTGQTKWFYRAQDSIRNNSIALGNDLAFFIDRPVASLDTILKSEATEMRRRKRALPRHPPGTLIAKDLRTGKAAWTDENIFGTTMAYNREHDVLIMSYNNVGRALPSDSFNTGALAYKGKNGEMLWEDRSASVGRYVMIGRTLWSYSAYDILTGEQRPAVEPDGTVGRRPWRMKGTGIGCGVWVGAQNILLRRSGTLGYYDLLRDTGWIDNYGAMRSGCWINTLPVGGIVLVPEDTQGCRCSYQNQASIALKERGIRRPDIAPIAGQTNFKIRTKVGREVVFVDELDIEIRSESKDVEVRYTLDGTFATVQSRLYAGPITIGRTTAVAASLFRDGRKAAVRDPMIFLKVSDREFDDFERIISQPKSD